MSPVEGCRMNLAWRFPRDVWRYAPEIYKPAGRIYSATCPRTSSSRLARNELTGLSGSINLESSRNNAAETLTNVNKIEPASRWDFAPPNPAQRKGSRLFRMLDGRIYPSVSREAWALCHSTTTACRHARVTDISGITSSGSHVTDK